MTEAIATIDLDDPPMEPPEGCVDPAMWQLARDRFELHRRTANGECHTCPRWKFCPTPMLPRDGLATALGLRVKESPFWIAFAEIIRGAERSEAGR